jgi:nitronate monooxygenase
MKFQNELTKSLHLSYPLVMAPMFLVSYEPMLFAALDLGILAAFPSLNYRDPGKLDSVLKAMNERLAKRRSGQLPGNYAVNLIVQKSNPYYHDHLAICAGNKVPVYITSLGNPRETIDAAHRYGAKVFCDVTNLGHAGKCHDLGCDGFIAVGHGAGGHAGNHPISLLVESLRKYFPSKPVMAAGGIATGRAVLSTLAAGASAAYIGTRFIASSESTVIPEYKDAIIHSGMDDIVMTERLSGTPCAVINTPFAKKIGTKMNRFEKWMSKNPRTKKYFKTLVNVKGMKMLEDAVKPGNYQNLWCAGQSVEMIDTIRPMADILAQITAEFDSAYHQQTRQAGDA